MEAATASVPQVQKRLYKNNTAGYVGVVVLDHNGQERGQNIEPLGTIWLSDAEAILTARASRRPEDNPFEEQVFIMQDPETQRRTEYRVRPVTLVSEGEHYVPAQDRYVPHEANAFAAQAKVTEANTGNEPANVTVGDSVAKRTAKVLSDGSPAVVHSPATEPTPVAAPQTTGSTADAPPTTAPPPAAFAAAAPPVRHEPRPTPPQDPQALSGRPGAAESDEERASWTEPPERPGEVLSGSLGGTDEPAPGVVSGDPTAPQPGDAPNVVPQAAPMPPGASTERYVPTPPEEEHAARVDPRVGEETGRAALPNQRQPEGEYARAEEVGSPDAPTSVAPSEDDSEGLIGG